MEAVTTAPAPTEALDEFEGAQIIAETLRDTAAKMPFDSEIRGMALRGRSGGTSSLAPARCPWSAHVKRVQRGFWRKLWGGR